jgi:hypothetical protein
MERKRSKERSPETIFGLAIAKALENGWASETGKGWQASFYNVILSRCFAKAFFGNAIVCQLCGEERPEPMDCCVVNQATTRICFAWEYHLAKMAVLRDADKYQGDRILNFQ